MLRVMIVEDERIIAMDLRDILHEAGHQVVGMASTLKAALAIAEALPLIDLAIMDVDLAEGSNGVDTARCLRERHGIPSLFVSSKVGDELRARAAPWNPAGFVRKPYAATEIVEAVTDLAG